MHLCIRVNKNPLNVVYWELRDGHLTSEYSLSLGIVSLYSRFRYWPCVFHIFIYNPVMVPSLIVAIKGDEWYFSKNGNFSQSASLFLLRHKQTLLSLFTKEKGELVIKYLLHKFNILFINEHEVLLAKKN